MRKFIFIHIPKTGGTSIRKFLEDNKIMYVNRHIKGSFHKSIRKFPIENKKYYSFAFVRNPYDRILSSWLMFQYKKEFEWKTREELINLTFRQFLERAINKNTVKYIINNNKFRVKHVEPQHHFVTNRQGKIGVNFIGRFENLEEDFAKVCDRLNIPFNGLPHLNSTKHKHYSEYYTKKTKELVDRIYKKDFELFNYEMKL